MAQRTTPAAGRKADEEIEPELTVHTDRAVRPLFPVFLKLEGRKVLVVGGGRVAAGRLPTLLASGARVSVVAPEVREDIESMPVRVERRPFRAHDVDGAWLVVAAASREVNRSVAEAAAARRVLVNAVDDPEAASAYTGGVLRRGGLTIAVSTEGQAPALAGLLREALEAVIPDDVSSWIHLAAALRAQQRQSGVPMAERRPLLLRALEGIYAARAAERTPPISSDRAEAAPAAPVASAAEVTA